MRKINLVNYPVGVRSRNIENVNGLSMHILESGYDELNKPLILLLHGFPELAYSWRKIIKPLSNDGFHVVAPDLRGYGKTTGGNVNYDIDISEYEISNLITDLITLVYALNKTSVHCLIGHDFGSILAGHAALIRPDIFKSVILMSAPFEGIAKIERKEETYKTNIHEDLASLSKPRKHYQWYYSERYANDDMINCSQGLKNFLRAYYHVKSADWSKNNPHNLKEWSASELAKLPGYYIMDHGLNMAQQVNIDMPSQEEVKSCLWLTNDELDYYYNTFHKTTFQGGLNYYRCMTNDKIRNKLKLFSNMRISVPSMFIAGKSDWGIYQKPGALENMQINATSNFYGSHFVEGAGHWVQQEKPEEVLKLFFNFLNT